jgi:hypothetical protein
MPGEEKEKLTDSQNEAEAQQDEDKPIFDIIRK